MIFFHKVTTEFFLGEGIFLAGITNFTDYRYNTPDMSGNFVNFALVNQECTPQMSNILKVNNVNDYARWVGTESPHPLICVINYSEVSPIRSSLNNYGVYGMFFQDKNNNELVYGCGRYDYKDGSLICVAPGQIGGKEDDGTYSSIGGWALLFHPDLLHGTHLENDIKHLTFFNYSVNEALHMSREEYEFMESILRQIQQELKNPHDIEQDYILVGYLNLLMMYSERFYNRQFLTRKVEYSDLLMRFQEFLHNWYSEKRQLKDGIPSVQVCAEALCMSPNYFSDLIKRLTGEKASHYIRDHVIQRAKSLIASEKTIAEVAYELGFEYPQHLTRMFKTHTGMSPKQYLSSLRQK